MCGSKQPKCLNRRYLRRNATHKCPNHKRLRDQHRIRTGLHWGAAGKIPSARAECSRRSADRPSWISVADRKRGYEEVLWYQDLSRVCPGCPQTTPGEARSESFIRKAYGQYGSSNLEPRTLKGRAKPPGSESRKWKAEMGAKSANATSMRPQSHLKARSDT